MELYQALENIKRIGPIFAEEEILCIREHKDEAIPELLRYVQYIVDNPNTYKIPFKKYDELPYAMFLLAEFRVNDALEPFIKMLEFDKKTANLLLGDLITSACGRLIASVAHEDDIDRIKLVIENTEIDGYQRFAALQSLVTMYFTGTYSREELVSYLGYVLNLVSESNDNGDDTFITFLVLFCHTVHAKEHFSRIMELYDKEMINRSIIQREEFPMESCENDIEPVFEKYILDRHTLIDDTIKEMSWWYCFKPKTEDHEIQAQSDNTFSPSSSSGLSSKSNQTVSKKAKMGRNDPCPCGSGKKYKKCCLNKG